MVVDAVLTQAHVAQLCLRLRSLLENERPPPTVVCDVSAVVDPDAGTVDALARLQLTARRLGCEIRLRGASPRLRELLVLVGLGDVLPCCYADGSELGRQAEEREQVGRVEKGVDPGDAAV
jgi:anti-anti-sigma regulatory factor